MMWGRRMKVRRFIGGKCFTFGASCSTNFDMPPLIVTKLKLLFHYVLRWMLVDQNEELKAES
jgi:hypothetical protein